MLYLDPALMFVDFLKPDGGRVEEEPLDQLQVKQEPEEEKKTEKEGKDEGGEEWSIEF